MNHASRDSGWKSAKIRAAHDEHGHVGEFCEMIPPVSRRVKSRIIRASGLSSARDLHGGVSAAGRVACHS